MQSFELSPGYFSWTPRRILGAVGAVTSDTKEKFVVAGISIGLLALIFGPAAIHAATKKQRRRAR